MTTSGTSVPDRFLRACTLWCVGLGGVAALLVGALRDMPSALGVLFGMAIGWANLWLLSRGIRKLIANPEAHRQKRNFPPVALLVKWPGLLLALVLGLLYAPITPEGVLFGAALSLVAATIAAIMGRKPPDDS